jgi:nitrite reductase/ring-hydroxylating ferredoxin subunit
MAELFVCKVGDISDGDVRIVGEGVRQIGVIMHRGEYFAYLNRCPHQGGPVCEGLKLPQVKDVIDNAGMFVSQAFDEDDVHLVCPWHGYEYHLATGVHAGDKRVKLRKFEVKTREGEIYVQL